MLALQLLRTALLPCFLLPEHPDNDLSERALFSVVNDGSVESVAGADSALLAPTSLVLAFTRGWLRARGLGARQTVHRQRGAAAEKALGVWHSGGECLPLDLSGLTVRKENFEVY